MSSQTPDPERRIATALSAADVQRCFPVMQELRPHLDLERFCDQVQRQEADGYVLVFLEEALEVCAVAGYRLLENLAWGRFMYVDDLVTRTKDQGRGYGRDVMEWLVEEARRQDCDQFHLDSGVQRFGAHRFYLGRGMDITAHHFAMKLKR